MLVKVTPKKAWIVNLSEEDYRYIRIIKVTSKESRLSFPKADRIVT